MRQRARQAERIAASLALPKVKLPNENMAGDVGESTQPLPKKTTMVYGTKQVQLEHKL